MTDDQLRRVTLCIARTPVMFDEGKVIQMYRRMAENVLKNSKTAGDIEDVWSKDYDAIWPAGN